MSTPTHTLKKCMQVLFVVLFFLAPASISVSDTLEVSVSPNTVHAQGAADRYSDSRTAAAKSGETEGLAAAVGSAITSKLADLGAPIVQAGVNFGGQFLLMIGSAILYLGGTVFDWVMKLFVVDFAIWVKSPEIWSAITSTWSIIRDVCNLVFIFGFIYIGISTILSPDSASMKRFLAKIVVGAILINFSLYFTQVIIDFSNYTAVAVYNAIDPSANKSIASAIKSYLGTDQAFFNIKGDNLATLGKDWAKGASYYFLVCIFLMVAGLTLLIAAFHLLARFIELLLLMILSPLYFASQVFPQTEKYAGKMMGKLISSAFYAPVYLLLLYLVLTMANVFSQKLQGDFVATLVQGDVSAAAVIVNYCIIIGLMWSAIHLGKTMSVTGGDIAIKWGTEVRKGAQGAMNKAATYVPRAGARYAVGRTSETLLNRFDRWQARPNNQQSRLGRVTRGALAFTDTDNTIRGTLTQGTQARMGLSQSYEQRQGVPATRRRRLNQTAAEVRNEEQFENALGTATNATGNLTQATNDLRTAVERLTDAQRQELDIPTLTNTRTALNLTDAHITALDNSGSFTAQEIQQIRDARTQARNNIVNYGDAGGDPTDPRITPQYAETQRRQLLRGNAAQIPVDFLASPNMAPYITPTMLGGRLAAGIEANDEARIRTNLEGYVNGLPLNDRNLNAWRQWATNTPIGIAFALNVP